MLQFFSSTKSQNYSLKSKTYYFTFTKLYKTIARHSKKMKEEIIEYLNKFRTQYLIDLGCTITDVSKEEQFCKMEFNIGKRYCHADNIIQGGFVTAMLDAVTAHVVFAVVPKIKGLSTLELKVTFYEVSRAGKLKAIGRIDRIGKSIAFLSGDLYNETGQRTASITTTAKFIVEKA